MFELKTPYRNQKNIDIFNDSQQIIAKSDKLVEATRRSVTQQRFVDYRDIFVKPDSKGFDTKITVTRNKTFDAARQYDGKTAALNFASATTPGGGCKTGANAQEECLCRVSNLWNCLNDQMNWDLFYKPHRSNKHPFNNDDLIYTPDVVVFKTDNYDLLPKDQWKVVDVITCAAPNLRNKDVDKQTQLQLHKMRAKKILNVAASQGVENVILGAFGCGVFNNDPQTVAHAYKEVLESYQGIFKNIEFAVYCGSDDSNYQAFNNTFN